MKSQYNIVVAQYYTSNLDHGPYAEKINTKYCEEHGYTYYCEKSDEYIKEVLEGRAPTWFKSRLILDIFEKLKPDYVLFLDTDAVVSNFSIRIEEFIDTDYNFIATTDNSHHSLMNAGVFLISNNEWAKSFLNKWFFLSTNLAPKDVTIKSEVSEHDLDNPGYFSNRLWMDQTILTYLYNDLIEYKSKIKIIPNDSLNYPVYGQGNFIFHAYSYGARPYRTLDKVYEKVFDITPVLETSTLVGLAQRFWTDKHFHHNYFEEVYQEEFNKVKLEATEIVELGVHEGASINIWYHFFPNAKITGVDFQIDRATVEESSRINLLNYNLNQREEVLKLAQDLNEVDIIIDDASHTMKDQQLAFGILFPKLKTGGIYVLEDLHTSPDVTKNKESIYRSEGNTLTLEMLEQFNSSGTIISDYMTEEERLYLQEHISECRIFKLKETWSYTSLIFKK